MFFSGGKEKNTNVNWVQPSYTCHIHFIFGHYYVVYSNFDKRCLYQVIDMKRLSQGAFKQII